VIQAVVTIILKATRFGIGACIIPIPEVTFSAPTGVD
jgi:hypothetical protein